MVKTHEKGIVVCVIFVLFYFVINIYIASVSQKKVMPPEYRWVSFSGHDLYARIATVFQVKGVSRVAQAYLKLLCKCKCT